MSSKENETFKGVKTGIKSWFQVYDERNNRFFDYDSKHDHVSWGLPLRDGVALSKIPEGSKIGSDDWECYVDVEAGKLFYKSVKYNKIQWGMPLLYKGFLANNEYFKRPRVSIAESSKVNVGGGPSLKRQDSVHTISAKISISDILEDDVACAAFHRFLMASHAEENLLFWGASEIFRKRVWKGMKMVGVGDDSEMDNEGIQMLQSQLVKSRASVKIGLPPVPVAAIDEARIIYDRFLKQDTKMEVCVDRKVANAVKENIDAGNMMSDRSVFVRAQEEVLRVMESDLLPRFLEMSLADHPDFQSDYTADEVVKQTLKRIAGSH